MGDAFDMRCELEALRAERNSLQFRLTSVAYRLADAEASAYSWRPASDALRGTVALVAEPGCGMAVATLMPDGWRDCHGGVIRPTHYATLPPWPCRMRGKAHGRVDGPCRFSSSDARGMVCEYCLKAKDGSEPEPEPEPDDAEPDMMAPNDAERSHYQAQAQRDK